MPDLIDFLDDDRDPVGGESDSLLSQASSLPTLIELLRPESNYERWLGRTFVQRRTGVRRAVLAWALTARGSDVSVREFFSHGGRGSHLSVGSILSIIVAEDQCCKDCHERGQCCKSCHVWSVLLVQHRLAVLALLDVEESGKSEQ